MSRRALTAYAVPAIPRVIHQMWLPCWIQAPAAARATRAEWCRLNPDWDYRFWDETAVEALIRRHYGAVLPLWQRLRGERVIKRADLARLLVLHFHGGLYVDMDLMPLLPLAPAGQGGRFLLASEEHAASGVTGPGRVCNGFLGGEAGRPEWLAALDGAERRAHGPVLDFLGPAVVSAALAGLPSATVLPWRDVLSTAPAPGALCRNMEIRSWGDPAAGGGWYRC